MPGPIRWGIVAVKEVGIPSVVIGVLFWIVFVNNVKMTDALNATTKAMTEMTSSIQTVQQSVQTNQKIIIKNQKTIIQHLGGKKIPWEDEE